MIAIWWVAAEPFMKTLHPMTRTIWGGGMKI